MRFDISLLVPTLRLSLAMASAMSVTVVVAWFGVGVFGLLGDIVFERWGGAAVVVWFGHAVALALVQIWLTREALERAGYRPQLSFAGVAIVLLQAFLVNLGILLGLLILVLPAFYVAARFYLAGSLLIQRGNGASVAMWRSWDLLETHWPTALVLGLMFASLWAVRLLLVAYWPEVAADKLFLLNLGLNLLSSIGIVGGYLTSAALLMKVEPPPSVYVEIFS